LKDESQNLGGLVNQILETQKELENASISGLKRNTEVVSDLYICMQAFYCNNFLLISGKRERCG